MAILSAEATKYLRENFGTAKCFDCKHCKLAAECNLGRRSTPEHCKLTTYADLFMLKEVYNHSCDTNVNSILNKIFKFKMLGFKQNITGPWVIFSNQDTGKEAWINPGFRAYGNIIYDSITIQGEFLICQSTANGVEVYHEGRPHINLMEGKPDIGNTITLNRRLYKEGVCQLQFNYQGKPGLMVLNSLGNGVICIGISDYYIMSSTEGYMIEGYRNKGFVRLTKDLKVKNKSGQVMTLEV